MDSTPDYVLVPSNSGGYTKMERATAQAMNQSYVELPVTGTLKSMVNPVYDNQTGKWTDGVATSAALQSLEGQLVSSGQDVVGQAAMALQALALAVATNSKTTYITNWADRIKSYRDLAGMGGWTDDQVANAVAVTWITANDYAAITGKSYVAG